MNDSARILRREVDELRERTRGLPLRLAPGGGGNEQLAIAQLNGTLSGGATATIDNFRVLSGAAPDPLPTVAQNTYALSGADNTYGLLRLVGTDWVLVALMTGSGGADETRVVRVLSDTMSPPAAGTDAIAVATIGGGKVFKAELVSWSGSAWVAGAAIRVLVSPAKAGETPKANHLQVLLGQLIGTRTESSVDYALYSATEAAAGGASSLTPCWVVGSCAAASRSGRTITATTIDVYLETGSGAATTVAEEPTTAYWNSVSHGITIPSSKSRQGYVATTALGRLDLLWIECDDVNWSPEAA